MFRRLPLPVVMACITSATVGSTPVSPAVHSLEDSYGGQCPESMQAVPPLGLACPGDRQVVVSRRDDLGQDGFGAQLQRIAGTYAVAREFGLEYLHVCGHSPLQWLTVCNVNDCPLVILVYI
jgi:hypothetical protein